MNIVIECHLNSLLKQRGWDFKTAHKELGIREATISEWARNVNKTFSREQIAAIMRTFELTDLAQLITVKIEE
ncbi:hypothetical protein AV545_04260 [Paenibacillus jamilae]|uniref:helix-turn-helix domain-containing protein n=1 Tax=Paenibacillus jamilae TaxID=114136 RepID=UPI0007AB8C83|nr:helix-turn-helix domain-containing protein [Paenibacillus jamilae]KZE65144.1 hypothetical protein AV545_04260 [Paenibacillus jamilae]